MWSSHLEIDNHINLIIEIKLAFVVEKKALLFRPDGARVISAQGQT
jgi:hypothetical protein